MRIIFFYFIIYLILKCTGNNVFPFYGEAYGKQVENVKSTCEMNWPSRACEDETTKRERKSTYAMGSTYDQSKVQTLICNYPNVSNEIIICFSNASYGIHSFSSPTSSRFSNILFPTSCKFFSIFLFLTLPR